mgnify:CR=1 FL=1
MLFSSPMNIRRVTDSNGDFYLMKLKGYDKEIVVRIIEGHNCGFEIVIEDFNSEEVIKSYAWNYRNNQMDEIQTSWGWGNRMNIVERAHFLIDCLNDESFTTTKDDLAEVSNELDEIIEKLIDVKIYQEDDN